MPMSASISSIPQWGFHLIKLLLLIALGYLIYTQIYTRSDMDMIVAKLQQGLSAGRWYYLAMTILLMPLNWWLESVKWRKLILPWTDISPSRAFAAVYAGLSVGIVTPARLGEYAGRLIMIPGTDKAKSVSATLVGSIGQNIINVIFGYLGTLVFLYCYFPINKYVYIAGSLAGLVLIAVLLMLFLHVSRLKLDILDRWPKLDFLRQQAHVIALYSKDLLTEVLQWSTLRYLTYMVQYVLILYFLGIEVPLLAAVSGVMLIYLIQSGIPLPPVLGVVARGEIALLVWSLFTENIGGILVATFGLWVINLVIPALIGLLIVLNVNNRKLSN